MNRKKFSQAVENSEFKNETASSSDQKLCEFQILTFLKILRIEIDRIIIACSFRKFSRSDFVEKIFAEKISDGKPRSIITRRVHVN